MSYLPSPWNGALLPNLVTVCHFGFSSRKTGTVRSAVAFPFKSCHQSSKSILKLPVLVGHSSWSIPVKRFDLRPCSILHVGLLDLKAELNLKPSSCWEYFLESESSLI